MGEEWADVHNIEDVVEGIIMWQIVRRGTIYTDGTSTDFDIIRKSDGVVVFKGSANHKQTAWHLKDASTGMLVRVLTWKQVVGLGEVK